MLAEKNMGLSIVSIGGGTGLATLLTGLKQFTGKEDFSFDSLGCAHIDTLTAVVTVTDDGGSSGRLREEFQILPPGDIRNCMVALAEDERLLTRLFQHRFDSEGDLSGHSFGNLFLAALAAVTGDFLEAIKVSSEVLAIKGRIFPSTTEDVSLIAELEDGRIIEGETKIVESRSRVKKLRLSREHCRPLVETLEAIHHADIITIGPGSLYTSIIPNLLVDGIVDAIKDSRAMKVYICNIMTQPGETDGFHVEDHLHALFEYAPQLAVDSVLVNSAPLSDAMRQKYLAEGAVKVEFTSGLRPPAQLQSTTSFRLICADLLNEDGLARHDPHKLARALLDLHQSEQAPHLLVRSQ